MFNFLPMFDYLILIRSVLPIELCTNSYLYPEVVYDSECCVCTDLIKPAYRAYALLYNGEVLPDSPVLKLSLRFVWNLWKFWLAFVRFGITPTLRLSLSPLFTLCL